MSRTMATRRKCPENREICTWAILLLLSFPTSASGDRLMLSNSWLRTTNRISTTDLQNRQSLERQIQLAAFQQFNHHKTDRLYNVAVPGISGSTTVQAIRLRAGSFARYGVSINEFSIPKGCGLNATPERILLVYAKLINSSLFSSLPDERILASSVVSVFAYDASNLNSTQPPNKLSITTTTSPITIRIQSNPGSSNLSCASFDENSTSVNYTASVQDVCNVTQLGAFALVTVAPRKSSNTWKIVVGSVIGGLALLSLLSLLAFALYKHRRTSKFAKMEYQAGQGETLQTASIRNSRAPAAGTTRTQPALESEYAV